MDALVILAIGMVVVIGGILGFKLHPFLALILGAISVSLLTTDAHIQKYAESKGMSEKQTQVLKSETTGKKIADGLGRTAGKIGILIAMAAIIGKCLLDSGAAERIVRSTLNILGEKRAPAAFMGSGFILGVPVYFDTVFYLMIPLAKSVAAKVGKNFGLYTMAIIAGATMAHSLVPPTPGPLLVAGELGVDIGKMILGGLVVGGCTLVTGYLYATWANKKFPIPLRDSADVTVEELEKSSQKDINELPPLWLSLLPIALPVFLIAGNTILPKVIENNEANQGILGIIKFFGNKDIALTISAILALWMLARQIKDRDKLGTAVQKAISGAGMIILITAAGGAFGGILQQTGIGPHIKDLATKYQISILPLAFFVTTLIRTAQGSATVAMITSVGIFSGMANQLAFDPLYLALAIGCGSKPFPWMNDSGFWVICKMSGMTEKETLKTSSTLMSLMALSGLIILMIASSIIPKF
ncbi:MAG: GntP family permease [Lentisphaeraceae bacterium]|nr:GntP family permease [Lentisphaeraceae bacterium]